ncbi:GTP cyclohydrolase II [Arenibaculum pallidiluteum]|uniref:GTP cyclohydrolase II n=1 Tax=Arenibaculum pallidiluteum TaxID=2812559 RepID=UPI001A95F809|nr:GTP cyclohydrolase II [Arenibaculum pallidiluteum]
MKTSSSALLQDRATPLDHGALRAVDRAVAELRRGDAVLVETEAGIALVAGVEGLDQHRLDALAGMAGAEPALAVTRTRAEALGLPDQDAAGIGIGDAAGAVMVLRTAGGITADRIRGLVDPLQPPMPVGELTAEPAEAAGPAGVAVALAKLARMLPAAVVLPLRAAQLGSPAATSAADRIAARHDLLRVPGRAVLDYQTHAARTLTRVGEARVPLEDAENARIVAFRPADGGVEHLAIVIGDPDPARPVLARIHSECFTGDLLGSLRCDCGDQLRGAIKAIAAQGAGVVLYLAQEGRGIGLVNKLRAYRLQDSGFDTVDANTRLGFEPDERVYLPAAEMLRGLGFSAVRLMTNNPDKLGQLARCGIEVAGRVPHVFASNGHNEAYLRTKAERSGHLF